MNHMKSSDPRSTFIDAAIPKEGLLWDTALVCGFACLTALCAQISFWIGPVPVSGQTFAVLLSGALLGSRRGALSQLSYLVMGATGIPYWFALGGAPGITRLIGPSAGYLFGFVAAAFIVGWLAEKGWGRHGWTATISMLAGSAAIYVFGLSWLSLFVQQSTLLQVGLYPFIIGDLLKILFAAITLSSSWLLLHRING
jgi:biotin transporter BioY